VGGVEKALAAAGGAIDRTSLSPGRHIEEYCPSIGGA